MTSEHKVIWSEGMFLEPQHFQQHDRYLEQLVEARIGPATPHSWGFVRIALDESALALGKVALQSATGIFPDGTPFDFPGVQAGPLPFDVPADTKDQLVVLALPLRRPGVPRIRAGRRRRSRAWRATRSARSTSPTAAPTARPASRSASCACA